MAIYEGTFISKNEKVAIVVSRFNEFITSKLLSGAMDNLTRHGIKAENVDIYWVPGAFEIPFLVNQLLNKRSYEGIIALGAVIRGATSHYELVTNEVAKGIAQLNLTSTTPIMFGVITTETIEQAIERAGSKAGNKGFEAAQGLIEMMSLTKSL